jgi:hypothetical protein
MPAVRVSTTLGGGSLAEEEERAGGKRHPTHNEVTSRRHAMSLFAHYSRAPSSGVERPGRAMQGAALSRAKTNPFDSPGRNHRLKTIIFSAVISFAVNGMPPTP